MLFIALALFDPFFFFRRRAGDMEEGGASNGQPTVDCADRVNKFKEQKPSRVNSEIEN